MSIVREGDIVCFKPEYKYLLESRQINGLLPQGETSQYLFEVIKVLSHHDCADGLILRGRDPLSLPLPIRKNRPGAKKQRLLDLERSMRIYLCFDMQVKIVRRPWVFVDDRVRFDKRFSAQQLANEAELIDNLFIAAYSLGEEYVVVGHNHRELIVAHCDDGGGRFCIPRRFMEAVLPE